MITDKQQVHDFWNDAACGENMWMKGGPLKQQFEEHTKARYTWEPEILSFAQFERHRGKKVLEIGVGLGADHQKWAEAGADLYGVDLTERAIEKTKQRLDCFGLRSNLRVADAENLPFEDGAFDVVYSWGVLLYCPDMYRGISEVHRVLKPGGEALVMLYNERSFVGYMLWMRYALLRLQPTRSLKEIYHHHLESQGTQAFTEAEVRDFFKRFSSIDIDVNLSHSDLLTTRAGQRHEGLLLDVARKVWPRALIKRYFPKHGLFMKIRAIK